MSLVSTSTSQAERNVALYRTGDLVRDLEGRSLRPVETLLLARYRDAFAGRVLELGCGAGRVLGYVVALGGEVHGIDVSPALLERCRRDYPEADVRVGDMRDLDAATEGTFDLVLAPFNVLDVLDDGDRRRVLDDIRRRLAPSGLLIFSAHNLAVAGPPTPGARRDRSTQASVKRLIHRLDRRPSAYVEMLRRLPARISNRRRLAPLERHEPGYAILNDEAFDYSLLHYYIRRDDQERQLHAAGYELVECLDLDGRTVPPGHDGAGPELYYVARAR